MRKAAKIPASVGAIALVLFGSSYWMALRNRNRAQRFLQQFVSLQLGESTFSDGQQLAQTYQGKPWSPPSVDAECSPRDCNLRFVFENKALSYLPFVHRVAFTASIGIKDGRIVGREVEYERDSQSYYDFMYVIRDSLDQSQKPVVQQLKIDRAGTPHVIEIQLGPLATAKERAVAYDLDLSCLAQFNACSDPRSIFPASIPTSGPL